MNDKAQMQENGDGLDIPVTIISGYLGAGKTTLINRLLQGDHGLRVAVLVNDFGEINIDAGLISDHEGQTISLTNGCVCCSIAGDLGQALGAVVALEPRAEHIIVEASGVADPVRIANYVRGQPGLNLNGTIVLADVETIKERVNDRFVGSTVSRQLSTANLIVMTKLDLVAEARLDLSVAWVQRKFPGVPIILPRDHAVEWALLMGATPCDCASPFADREGCANIAPHTAQFATTTWLGKQMLSRDRTIKALRSLMGDILRCKGWVCFDDNPNGFELVQMVGSRMEITRVGSSEQRPPALSFIYRRDSLSPQRLDIIMAACEAQQSSNALPPNAPG